MFRVRQTVSEQRVLDILITVSFGKFMMETTGKVYTMHALFTVQIINGFTRKIKIMIMIKLLRKIL